MRSKLFVPGSRPELFEKAFRGAADAISLDLEDSVPEDAKPRARANIGAWLDKLLAEPGQRNGKTVIVRINEQHSPHFKEDLKAVVRTGVDIINIPKPANPKDIQEFCAAITALESEKMLGRNIGVLLNIEHPHALRTAAELATADKRIVGLQLGLADLFEPLQIARDETSAIEQAMFTVAMAAGEAGIYAIDAAFGNIRDTAGFQAEAELARRFGFIGKSCIHPSQVQSANTAFSPSSAEIDFAKRVIAAAGEAEERGQGACVVDGKMIDKPFVQRARTILATSLKSGPSTS